LELLSKMSGYTKDCIFCKKQIRLSNDSGKWLPYDITTGEIHECRESVKGKDKRQVKQEQPQKKQ
jgi:hypothetical protein